MTDAEILEYPQQAYYSQEYREQWLAERDAEEQRRLASFVSWFNAAMREIYSDAVDAEVTEWKS
jgi:hypothetical protein